MTPDRIAVIGVSASGKSTFARALGAKTGLPVLHGDRLDWMEDWGVRPEADLDAMHAEWLARPRWIIEGWIDPARVRRLDAADLVIDLDFSRWRCTARVLRRMLAGARRAEMPEGCVDRFQPKVLWWMLCRAERPHIDSALAAATLKAYVRLKTQREAARLLDGV
jgi:adenylate kinase family enzyme